MYIFVYFVTFIDYIYRGLNPGADAHLTSTDFQSQAYAVHKRNRELLQQQHQLQVEQQKQFELQRQMQQQQSVMQQLPSSAAANPAQGLPVVNPQQPTAIAQRPEQAVQPMDVSHGGQQMSQLLLPKATDPRRPPPGLNVSGDLKSLQETKLLDPAQQIQSVQQMQMALAMQNANIQSQAQYAAQRPQFSQEDLRSVMIGFPEINLNMDQLVAKPGAVGKLLQILNSPEFSRAIIPVDESVGSSSFMSGSSHLGSTGSTIAQSMESMDASAMSLTGINTSSQSLTDSQKDLYGVESGVHWPIGSKTSLQLSRYVN